MDPALRVRHAIAGERREVVVQHPSVGADVGVERDGDGVDGRRQRAMCLRLTDARVRAQRGGDGHVAGELSEQSGVEWRVGRHVSKANPRVEDRWTNRRVGITAVRTVDDADVAPDHTHVARKRPDVACIRLSARRRRSC